VTETGEIVVRVRCFGFGQQPSRVRERTLALPRGATVGDLLVRWRAEENTPLPDNLLVILNGRSVGRSLVEATGLSHGDEVTLMRPVAGGRRRSGKEVMQPEKS